MVFYRGFIAALVLAATVTYVIAYGSDKWRNRHRIRALMIFILAIAIFMLHIYSFF